MQTFFAKERLADSTLKEAERILRSCVHCGFCLPACPTYRLLGDERDSPRGRIYLIKDMLEHDRPASATVTTHLDRCLSCLACMSACPSSVDYMHLIDEARARVAATAPRSLGDRLLRRLLGAVLPRPRLFGAALMAARLIGAVPGAGRLLPKRLAAMLRLAPAPASIPKPEPKAAPGGARRRVALLAGCVQPALRPAIDAAATRLLGRHGCDVLVAPGSGCCGAINLHLGQTEAAKRLAKANIEAWEGAIAGQGVDAIVATASGCGTMVKDYGHLLRDDPEWAGRAARIAALARDISEVLADLPLAPRRPLGAPPIVYQSPCSMQHGQRVHGLPRDLLSQAGFDLRPAADETICCGSAGTYSLLQPDLAGRLGAQKAAALAASGAAVVATGNIGCLTQLAAHGGLPVVHTVELLDWATGGPAPAELAK